MWRDPNRSASSPSGDVPGPLRLSQRVGLKGALPARHTRPGNARGQRDPTARDLSEEILQADCHRQIADALEALRGVKWGDAVRLHGRMASDEVPRHPVIKTDGVSPAPRHTDRRVLGQCVVGASEQLETKRCLTHRRIEGAEVPAAARLAASSQSGSKSMRRCSASGFRMNWMA